MKNTDVRTLLATYPLTIGSPFGDIRLSYKLDSMPCPDCGDFHGHVTYLKSDPRLSTSEALPFVEILPVLLLNAGRVADLSISTEILLTSAAARRA